MPASGAAAEAWRAAAMAVRAAWLVALMWSFSNNPSPFCPRRFEEHIQNVPVHGALGQRGNKTWRTQGGWYSSDLVASGGDKRLSS
eukprot:1403103-Amphidinium_carterae.1